jgi:Bacterial extracellular solute-binding protein
MSNLFPACSRLDLYKQYTDLDLRKMFPPNNERDKSLADSWNWDLYLSTAEKLFKAGYPVGLPMEQTADRIDWVSMAFRSFGSVFIDEEDNIKINSDETRMALEFMKKIMSLSPPDVYAWDDAGNNKWLISGRGSSIFNPPSAWAVAVRDNPKVAEQCWSHDVPRGPRGRFTAYNVQIYGIWNFSKNKEAAKNLIMHLSEREQVQQLVAASHGYDIPPFLSF